MRNWADGMLYDYRVLSLEIKFLVGDKKLDREVLGRLESQRTTQESGCLGLVRLVADLGEDLQISVNEMQCP